MDNPYKKYDSNFYKEFDKEGFTHSAERVLSVVAESLPPIKSAVDVGCGTGYWLQTLKANHQTETVKGIDGRWVDRQYLKIQEEDFLEADMAKALPDMKQRFDLAISLEVAEHLPPERANEFVNYLTTLSDFVLFSAATPSQSGTNHLNEQWQDYWADIFEKKGYVPFDIIRPKVWNDVKVVGQYKQNTVLYVNKNKTEKVNAPYITREELMLSVGHPCHLNITMKTIFWRGALRKALKRSFKRIFRL